ncbi:hypothetical protein J437_LFUL001170 [Ladona fulva]|uniref:Uncharacterized protein n=1 Tax=Ladona fulva TaxID=123851 RepID=A0A8K0NVC3_LADFU|nr:hypothetical protein J437_LFUL001170 [Ladona fulva]
MDSVIEELQLLGICDLDDEESSSLDKAQIIRSLLNLYYCTFKDKTEMEEMYLSLNSEIRKLKDDQARADNRFTAQEVLISNFKREQKILQDKLKDTNELLLRTKKEAEKEKHKWERWAQLQRISSSKVLNQLSVVKEELRKKTCGSSSNSRKPLLPVQRCQMSMPKSLSLSKEEVLQRY